MSNKNKISDSIKKPIGVLSRSELKTVKEKSYIGYSLQYCLSFPQLRLSLQYGPYAPDLKIHRRYIIQ